MHGLRVVRDVRVHHIPVALGMRGLCVARGVCVPNPPVASSVRDHSRATSASRGTCACVTTSSREGFHVHDLRVTRDWRVGVGVLGIPVEFGERPFARDVA